VAYGVFLAPLNDVGILNRVMFAALSRLQDDETRLKRGFLRATEYATMVVLPIMLGLSLVAPLAVAVLFGSKWMPSAPVIRLLALAGFFQLMMTFAPTALQAAGRPDLRLQIAVLSAMLYVPAFVLGLRWGIVGVAAGYLVASLIMFPIIFGFVSRVMGMRLGELWRTVRGSVVASIAMAVVVVPLMWLLETRVSISPIIALAFLVAIGAVVYGGVMWLVQPQGIRGLFQAVRDGAARQPGPRLREVEEV
jgi:PST family polysaccharide transporter